MNTESNLYSWFSYNEFIIVLNTVFVYGFVNKNFKTVTVTLFLHEFSKLYIKLLFFSRISEADP